MSIESADAPPDTISADASLSRSLEELPIVQQARVRCALRDAAKLQLLHLIAIAGRSPIERRGNRLYI